MSRHRRNKASDVFRDTKYFFGGKAPFEEVFPEIESFKVISEEKGKGVYEGYNVRQFSLKNNPGEYINCSNRLCYNGGFSLGSILREMVREKKTKWKGLKICQGYEGSPKGRRYYGSCGNHWNVSVEIKYKEKNQENDT